MADGKVVIDVEVNDNDAEKKLKDVEDAAEEVGDGLEDLGDGAGKSGKGLDLLNVAAGNLIAGGISGLISGLGDAVTSLLNLADETREFREDMAKLDTAFKTAGHNTEDAQKAYEDFYAILGESDRSVEAVNHLAELTNNTEELSKWSTIAAGVTAKFGDSLPIEGLTEAANETAKVSKTTGVLADALNWASADSAVFTTALGGNDAALKAFNASLKAGEPVEDAFTAALEKMTTEQERSTAITATLNGLYSEAAVEYNTLTASAQAARRATAEQEEAQARLGEAIEPFKTKLTEVQTIFLNLGANVLENALAFGQVTYYTSTLTEEQQKLVEQALTTGETFETLKLSADNAAIGIASQFNYTQSLANELLRLVDNTGLVQEADQARVEFILGELNSALGTEYTMTGNVISNYQTLKNSIFDVIEAKKAQILLAEYETQYAEAVKNVAAQEEARATKAIELAQIRTELEKAELDERLLNEQYTADVLDGLSREEATRWAQKLQAAQTHTAGLKTTLEEESAKYHELDSNVNQSFSAINAYEQASTAILQGETQKAINILNNYGNGFNKAAESVDGANKKEIEVLKQKVMTTSVQLGLLESEYKEKQGSMTKAEQEEMQKRINNAKQQAQDARAEYAKVGGEAASGIAKGISNNEYKLTAAMRDAVRKAIEAGKKEAEIHSPSKETEEDIGIPLVEGIAKGVTVGQTAAINSIKDTTRAILDTMSGEVDKEIAWLESENKKLEKEATAKKKLFKEDIEAVKQREEDETEWLQREVKKQDKIKEERIKKEVEGNKKLSAEKKKKLKEQIEEETKQKKELLQQDIDAAKERYEQEREWLERERDEYQETVDAKKELIKEDIEAAKARKAVLSDYGKTHETLLSNITKLQENYAKESTRIQDEMVSNMQKAADAYNSAYESTYKGIKNSFKLFEYAVIEDNGDDSKKLKDSGGKGKILKEMLESQLDMHKEYNEELGKLSGKGVNQEFVDELKNMGIEILPQLKAINSMTDEELSEYVGLWEEKNALALEATESIMESEKKKTLETIYQFKQDANAELEKLDSSFRNELIELASEVATGMKESGNAGLIELGNQIDSYVKVGQDLMEGVAEGMAKGESKVLSTMLNSIRKAVTAAKDELDINSPSKVTEKEIGFNMALGVGSGWDKKLSELKTKMSGGMSDVIERMRSAVSTENARVGVRAIPADTSISDLANAVGAQTSGINALAYSNKGSASNRPIIIQIDKRELGRAIVDVGSAENTRLGAKLSLGGAT